MQQRPIIVIIIFVMLIHIVISARCQNYQLPTHQLTNNTNLTDVLFLSTSTFRLQQFWVLSCSRRLRRCNPTTLVSYYSCWFNSFVLVFNAAAVATAAISNDPWGGMFAPASAFQWHNQIDYKAATTWQHVQVLAGRLQPQHCMYSGFVKCVFSK